MDRNLITFVLGAGASLPFLLYKGDHLSTQLIARMMKDDDIWRSMWMEFETAISERDHASPGCVDHLDVDEALALRNLAVQTLDGTRFDAANFEYLVHLIDKASYYLAAHRRSDVSQLDASLLFMEDTLRSRFVKTDHDGWRYVPWLAREVVLHIVLEAWDALVEPRRKAIFNLHIEFFRRVAHMFGSVHVYNLNYDPLISEALRPLTFQDGFLSGEFWPRVFDQASLSMASLHGHLGFVPRHASIELEVDYRAARQRRIRAIVQNDHSGSIGMKGAHAGTIISTGLDKIDPLSRDPFSTYYQRYARDQYDSHWIAIVGVGLGDDHLTTFIRNLPILRKGQRLVVVTKMAPDRLAALASSGDSYLLTLASTTGDHFAPTLDFETHLRAVACELATKGHAKFSEHIILYVKGTEEFYAEGDRLLSGL